jgi:NADPH:quinone reductase
VQEDIMRAAVYDTAGPRCGELRLVDLPDPAPGSGEVLVRVQVSAVNPTDWKRRRPGIAGRPWAEQVPGQDGAGTIVAVGPGVDRARVGQRVWLHFAAFQHPLGSAAELVVLPEGRAVPLADDVTLDVGASLGIPGITAHRCLLRDGDVTGLTVLVTGAAGAVGHLTVQLARAAGARVVATASSPEKIALAAAAGADVVLDRHHPDHAAQLRQAVGEGIDRVVDVDLGANLTSYVELLREHAVVAGYADFGTTLSVPFTHLMRRNITLRTVLVYGMPEADVAVAVAHVDALLQAGRLVHLPVRRFPLAAIADAHEAVRTGSGLGRVLVDIT